MVIRKVKPMPVKKTIQVMTAASILGLKPTGVEYRISNKEYRISNEVRSTYNY